MSPQPPNTPWRTSWALSRGDTSEDVLVLVTEDHIRHVYNGHINSPGRPEEHRRWVAFLTTGLMNRIDSCWGDPQAARNLVLDELAAKLEPEVRQSLAAPQFIEYEEIDLSEDHRHNSMELLTPQSLIVVLRRGTRRLALQTAFFPDADDLVRPKQLRKETERDLVYKYSERLDYASYSYLTLPQPTYRIPSIEYGSQVGWRTKIQFIDPEKWGFRQEVLPGPPAPPEWIWRRGIGGK